MQTRTTADLGRSQIAIDRAATRDAVMKRMRPWLVALMLCLGSQSFVGCTEASTDPDVVVIVLDTLRADHLESYGYGVSTSPNLSKLAAQGVLYERVVAPSSWTKTSMASIWTSRNPLRHGVLRKNSILPPELTTLAQAFRQRGYQTIGVSSNPWLKEKYGFSAGFDDYQWLPVKRGFAKASAVTRRAVERMAAADCDRPVLLYVHYMDVHPPYSSRSQPRPRALVVEGYGTLSDKRLELMYRKNNLHGLGVQQRILDLYDAGIREVDTAVGELIAGLDGLNRRQARILAVTADHGEAFREHGTTEHGRNIYPEVYEVPMLLVAPELAAGTRITKQMRSIDLAPTLLAMAGAPIPESFDGRPLPLGANVASEHRTAVSSVGYGAYVSNSHYVAIVTGDALYIRERIAGTAEFYALEGDPDAQNDLGGDHPDAVELAQIEAALEIRDAHQTELDSATVEALKSLGYLQ